MGFFRNKQNSAKTINLDNINLQPVEKVQKTVGQILKYNSLVSDLLGIGFAQSDPIENVGSREKLHHGSGARNVYRSLDIVQRIIDDPAEQALRHGFKFKTNFDELGLSRMLSKRLEELQFNEKALDFLINSRLYSKGALFIPILQERLMDFNRSHVTQPLRLNDIEEIEGFNVIQEDFFDYHIQSYDPFAVDFNAIEHLTLQGTPIHPSRCFLTVLSLDPHLQRGISILDRIEVACKGINIAEWTITNLLLRYRALLVKFPAKDMLNYVEDKKSAIRNLINDIKMKFSSKSVSAIPDNFEFEYLQTSFAGLKEATEFLYEYLATVSKQPQSIIKGSAMGQLASAEKDERTYQDYIKSGEQEKKLKPLLQFLIPILLYERNSEIYRTLAVHGIASKEVDVEIEFNSMMSVNPLQDSQRKLLDSQRAGLDIQNTIRDIDEVRAELYPTLETLEESLMSAESLGEAQQDFEGLQNPSDFFELAGLPPMRLSE